MDVEEYQFLKAREESIQRQLDRIYGALEQNQKQLDNKFGCKSLEKANKLIENGDKEIEQLDKECRDKLKEFESRFGGRL